MLNFIKNFRNDEDGAVTVDWVVLTAAVVALSLAVGSTVKTGIDNLAGTISDDLGAQTTALSASGGDTGGDTGGESTTTP